jgi:hypothetical protein
MKDYMASRRKAGTLKRGVAYGLHKHNKTDQRKNSNFNPNPDHKENDYFLTLNFKPIFPPSYKNIPIFITQ